MVYIYFYLPILIYLLNFFKYYTFVLFYLFYLIYFRPGHEIVGSVHVKQLYEIALSKKRNTNLQNLSEEAIVRTIIGQCSSMGIKVRGMDYVEEEEDEDEEEGEKEGKTEKV